MAIHCEATMGSAQLPPVHLRTTIARPRTRVPTTTSALSFAISSRRNWPNVLPRRIWSSSSMPRSMSTPALSRSARSMAQRSAVLRPCPHLDPGGTSGAGAASFTAGRPMLSWSPLASVRWLWAKDCRTPPQPRCRPPSQRYAGCCRCARRELSHRQVATACCCEAVQLPVESSTDPSASTN